jgi:hypothetical protein
VSYLGKLDFVLYFHTAVDHYETWAKENTPVINAPPLTSLTPYYLPFWVFECTVVTESEGNITRDPSPRASLQVAPSTPHCTRQDFNLVFPAFYVQIYAGHTFRRSATGVLKTPVDNARQFTARMLEDAGDKVEIDVKGVSVLQPPPFVRFHVFSAFKHCMSLRPGSWCRLKW